MYSGSEAEASQRLLRMKMLGLDRRSFTLWKKNFSYRRTHTGGVSVIERSDYNRMVRVIGGKEGIDRGLEECHINYILKYIIKIQTLLITIIILKREKYLPLP